MAGPRIDLRNRLYYSLKPLLPWALRMAVRRQLARYLRYRHTSIWPIDPATANPPPGWKGWPENKESAFVLTHDVEGPAGLVKVRRLAELEMRLGFRSCFNFIPEGSYRVPPDLLQWLSNQGFEIGVHDLQHDGRLLSSRTEFTQRAIRINQYLNAWGASGFRAGFMLHNLSWFHDLAIKWDASTFDTDPFEPQPDAACTLFPFVVRSSQSRFVELPYTLPQDSTLFLVLREKTSAIWLQKLAWVQQRRGMALVNVHPDYLQFEHEASRPKVFPVARYIELLAEVKKHSTSTWMALPRDVAAWTLAPVHTP